MISWYPQKIWFYPPDFMEESLRNLFVGYEASARFSELAKEYPDLIESRRRGKYFERRLKFENMPIIKRGAELGIEMFDFFMKEIEQKGINYLDFMPKPRIEFQPESTAGGKHEQSTTGANQSLF